MMTEGNSLRAISRMADVSINTVTKLLVPVGSACSAHLDANMVNLPCKRIQVDEIWAFCYAKAKNVTREIADTPAMQANISDHVWSLEEIADLAK